MSGGHMSGGTIAGYIAGIVVCLGLGGLALVLTIRALASSEEPDITTNTGQKMGRSGLLIFLVLGVIFVIAGIALIVALAKGGK
jgi:hypothetical protein